MLIVYQHPNKKKKSIKFEKLFLVVMETLKMTIALKIVNFWRKNGIFGLFKGDIAYFSIFCAIKWILSCEVIDLSRIIHFLLSVFELPEKNF